MLSIFLSRPPGDLLSLGRLPPSSRFDLVGLSRCSCTPKSQFLVVSFSISLLLPFLSSEFSRAPSGAPVRAYVGTDLDFFTPENLRSRPDFSVNTLLILFFCLR